jgi:hypothetical protein
LAKLPNPNLCCAFDEIADFSDDEFAHSCAVELVLDQIDVLSVIPVVTFSHSLPYTNPASKLSKLSDPLMPRNGLFLWLDSMKISFS